MPNARRVAVACLMQETNSFTPRKSTTADFEWYDGAAVRAAFTGTNSEVSGFLEGAPAAAPDVVPIAAGWAISGGPVERSSLDEMTARICRGIEQTQPDAVLLALHGALVIEDGQSGDAEIARQVRRSLGPEKPLVVTLDLHGNVHPPLLDSVDGLVGYRTYPHIDMKHTGLRACRLLGGLLAGRRARRVLVSLPMLLSAEACSTNSDPLGEVVRDLDAAFRDDEGRFASFFPVQPWLDADPVGSSLVVTEFGPHPETEAKLERIAARWWSRRGEYRVDWTPPDHLFERIERAVVRPVLVSEAFDAPNSGAKGDNPGLLSCLVRDPDRFRSCVFLVDAPAAKAAIQAGPGARVAMRVGGTLDPLHSRPLEIAGEVVSASDGRFTLKGPVFTGRVVEMGPSAVVRIGGIRLLLASRPVIQGDPEMYRSQGIEPAGQDVVGLKSPTIFRAAYDAISREVLHLDMPGAARGNLRAMPFRFINRPIYPLDEFTWSPKPVWRSAAPGAA